MLCESMVRMDGISSVQHGPWSLCTSWTLVLVCIVDTGPECSIYTGPCVQCVHWAFGRKLIAACMALAALTTIFYSHKYLQMYIKPALHPSLTSHSFRNTWQKDSPALGHVVLAITFLLALYQDLTTTSLFSSPCLPGSHNLLLLLQVSFKAAKSLTHISFNLRDEGMIPNPFPASPSNQELHCLFSNF